MNRYDDGDGADAEDPQETKSESATSDGMEIALPENAGAYELLMGESPEDNPQVQKFRDAYDKSMADNEGGDHESCMDAGRAALEEEDSGEGKAPAFMAGKTPMMGKMMGKNPLNAEG